MATSGGPNLGDLALHMKGSFICGCGAYLLLSLLFSGSLAEISGSVSGSSSSDLLLCDQFTGTDSIAIGQTDPKLLNLHIRHNLKGDVVIKDGDSKGSGAIQVEIEKAAPSPTLLAGIQFNNVIYDEGRGNLFILQVDYVESASGLITIIVGSVATLGVVIAVVSLIGWWHFKKRHQPLNEVPTDTCALGEERSEQGSSREECGRSPRGAANDPSKSPCPPPPPPRRQENIYISTQLNNAAGRKPMGGAGSPRGLSRSTVVTLSLVMVLSLVYAQCVREPTARIVITIPPVFKLDGISLYFKRQQHNRVITDGWKNQNETQLNVFDLEDAGFTNASPCQVELLCTSAYLQGLAGCDPATGSCLCQRGYTMSNGICIDIDECSSGTHACPASAACRNTIASYVCQCGYGFYGDHGTCIACSVGCPAGQYENRPCSNTGDRTCTGCRNCGGSMYEASPCRGSTNRECIHVAHPLLISEGESMPAYYEGMKVEKSENVFVENLHGTRNLETTIYVTDMTQNSDFFWVRESGLQVHIGIFNIHLMPEYEDFTHDSDNKYMMSDPNTSEDKSRFRKLIREYCRHPIPDLYSITLEISRDRMTAAESVTCNADDPNTPKCPEGYNNGDKYLHRSLNTPCEKMGTFPDDLVPAKNSVVCTKDTDLLRKIFNQTYAPERAIPFPTKVCREATKRCTECIEDRRCQMTDLFDKQCCQIDCFTLKNCKISRSVRCESTPVECAMGDAFRYTIQPVFQNLEREFSCHIKHRKPKVLYQIFFHIKVPGPYGPESELDTPRVTKTIPAHDFDYHSTGTFQADYISIEHNTGLNLEDEFVLVGQEIPSDSTRKKMNYTLFPMKREQDFSQRKVVVHEISKNIFVASTQFKKPFDYSSSSWVKDTDCNKDVKKFKYVQKHYRKDSGQPINLMIQTIDSPYQYFIKAAETPPTLRFTVPGNTSVLPWYFQNNGPKLITNNSLDVSLELVAGGHVWNIIVKGQLTHCPGYVGITINDRLEMEELFRYDTLIFCPPEFNITFHIPNRGRRPERTFEVILVDPHHSYSVYLTHMLFEQPFRPPKMADSTQTFDVTSAPWTFIAIVVTTTFALLMLFNLFYGYLELSKSKAALKKKEAVYYQNNEPRVPTEGCRTTKHRISEKQYIFIVSYIVFRILYSLIFTFTVFLAIIVVALKEDFSTLNKVSHFQSTKYNESRRFAFAVDKYGQDELLRQAKLMTAMQGACSNYVEELFETMLIQVENITTSQQHSQMYGDKSSISTLMREWYDAKLLAYSDKVTLYSDKYKTDLKESIAPSLKGYKKYLSKVFQNLWFKFPQLLFNRSTFAELRPDVFKDANLAGIPIDFGAYLPIEEVEMVQLWSVRWWERYYNRQPGLPGLRVPRVSPYAPACDLPSDSPAINFTHVAHSHDRLHSARYTAPHLPGHSVIGPRFKDARSNIDEEYKYLFPADKVPPPAYTFSMEEFSHSLSLELLRIIFAVLDVIVLLYRATHIFMTAKTLCRGFEETKTVHVKKDKTKEMQKLQEHLLRHVTDKNMSSQSTEEKDFSSLEFTVPDYAGNQESQRSMLPKPHPSLSNSNTPQHKVVLRKNNHVHVESDDTRKWTRRKGRHYFRCLVKLAGSTVVPKVLIGGVVFLLLYIVLQAVYLLFTAEVMADAGAFQAFLAGLQTQVNQTNWYLTEQARHFNDIVLNIYKNQMHSELLNLEGIMEYFNAEQSRQTKNYVEEACAIRKHLIGSRPCDIEVDPAHLDILMLPCNFVPIQPELYTDLDTRFSPAQLGKDFEPILTAARRIVINVSYALMVVVAVMILVHAAGCLLFHFLKTRQLFPVHWVFVTSVPIVVLESTNQIQEVSDSEEEEEEVDGARVDETELKQLPAELPTSPEKLKSLLSNFKYSETKV